MTLPSSTYQPRVLSDLVAHGAITNTAVIIGGTGLLAAAAQLTVPLWPVPITGQTFAVLILGAALGARRAAATTTLYLLLGAIGLPIFTGATSGNPFTMPSGGYLVGFIAAATLIGYLAKRGWDRTPLRSLAAFALGSAAMYAIALPWLAISLSALGAPHSLSAVLAAGLVPFLIGDALKAALAAGLLPLTWRLTKGDRH
ncbi:biotin transporter BioY [Curtobacterium sp. Csp1]|uniref:biotin transporter BioY n=1 Tax=Curtobacterium sp. Csp1 TaxID=2495429 RepID=UPI00159AEE3E|nr:biotin transporter BioY [Curtobacterium sp. Csp1]QKS19438.1 biotin transporter BioY [Curtobacterium sp. Csp1]